jgi:hypothetical protein
MQQKLECVSGFQFADLVKIVVMQDKVPGRPICSSQASYSESQFDEP